MSAIGRQSAAAAVAALAAAVPVLSLTEDRSFLLLGLVLVLLSAGIGALLRRAGAGEGLVRLAQLTPVMLVPLLAPEARDPLALYVETAEFVQVAFAPMPFNLGFALFCAILLWVVYLLIETLSIGMASPAWTFPVLVLPYLMPSLAIYAETSPFLFAFPAVGYAFVLATASRNQASGEGTSDATAAGWRRGVATTATLSTALALVGAMMVSLPLPERSANSAAGLGSGAVQLGDPAIDLVRNLNEATDRVVITYRTSDNEGHYLRLAALTRFDATGFRLTSTDLIPLQFGGEPPQVATADTVQTSFKIGLFDAQYLPVPWFPVTAQVPGDNWRYDPKTLAVVAIGGGRLTATRNLTYTTTTARLPAAETLLPTLTAPGDPGDAGLTLELPPELSPGIRELALDVVERSDADTAGGKALALAEFLRSEEFTYNTAATTGTTMGTLDDFLLGSRVGYCEQFAGSLAVLARVVGIPSRVVVGFLPGKRQNGQFQVSTRNMHAWAELYFGEGVGWVPVDATPAGAVAGNAPSASPSASPSSASASPTTSAAPATPTVVAPDPGVQTPADGSPAGMLGWAAGAATLLVLVGAGPGLTRAALRRFRLAGWRDPAVASERAWAEVRAVTLDHGRRWPSGTSRQVAAQLGADLDASGAAALAALALAVERARYDRDPVPATPVAVQVRDVTRAMEKRWARRPTAGSWWPRSLRPRRS